MKILVCGAGPTGLAASLFLTARGHEVRLVEHRTEPTSHSKAFGVNPRTLELLEPVGVTERFLANGRRMPALNLWVRGRRVLRSDLTGVPHRFAFMLVQSQADSERLLAEALVERGLRIERGLAVERVDVHDGGVCCDLSDGSRAEADVLLGADGARSKVREQCGIAFEGADGQEPWELHDVDLVGDVLNRDEAHVFMLDGGAMFLVRIRDQTWRVLGNLPGLLDRLPPGLRAGTVHWRSDFGIAQKVAAAFEHRGRVFLAGDSAHIHAGLGARGMNLGIEDAHVFAELLTQGRLTEYGKLRRNIVLPLMRRIQRMTDLMRGRSTVARWARTFVPLVAPVVAPLALPAARRFVLGLDHEV